MYVNVALPLPLRELFTYHIPDELLARCEPGKRVWVSFGRQKQLGVIVEIHGREPSFKTKPIQGLVDREAWLTPAQLELAQRMSVFYACSLGEVLQTMAPSPEFQELPSEPDPVKVQPAKHPLTDEQRSAFEALSADQDPLLLFGLTGTGKTEVYLEAAEACLQQGQQVLFMVPEIGLTPQLASRVRERFGSAVAITHSNLSPRERWNTYARVWRGDAVVVLGPRSACLGPFRSLKLMIVDEEHDASYKSQETPRYHGRQVAFMLRQAWGAALVLGSATPSLESAHHAGLVVESARPVLQLKRLEQRHGQFQKVQAKLIDMRRTRHRALISPELRRMLEERLDRNEQSILFLNRRGYSNLCLCDACGTAIECPNCDLTLTYHRHGHKLHCHTCGHWQPLQSHCESCGNTSFLLEGFGTQQVEQALQEMLPDAVIARMDRDTTSKKGAHARLVDAMQHGRIDILLGTQMVSKGLHFPNVTLSAVLLADMSLNQPDFRAAERTFQLINQVAGRAGRGELAGEVVVQTYNPLAPAIRRALDDDLEGFLELEQPVRQRLRYPPFMRLVRFQVRSHDASLAESLVRPVAKAARAALPAEAMLLGPAEARPFRVKNNYRYALTLKVKQRSDADPVIHAARTAFGQQAKAYLEIDVDPV